MNGKAMQCFMLLRFNGRSLMWEGHWICGLPNFSCHHYARAPLYTVHESYGLRASAIINVICVSCIIIVMGAKNAVSATLKVGRKSNATLQS